MFGKKAVSCRECKCLMFKRDAHKVVVIDWMTPLHGPRQDSYYYCTEHCPPYHKIYYGPDNEMRYFKKWQEVDEKGKCVK